MLLFSKSYNTRHDITAEQGAKAQFYLNAREALHCLALFQHKLSFLIKKRSNSLKMNCNQNITIQKLIQSFVSTELSQICNFFIGNIFLAWPTLSIYLVWVMLKIRCLCKNCFVMLYIKYRDTAVVCQIPESFLGY